MWIFHHPLFSISTNHKSQKCKIVLVIIGAQILLLRISVKLFKDINNIITTTNLKNDHMNTEEIRY